jgi:hypothetical protein
MALLYGHAGRLAAQNGIFRPGQVREFCLAHKLGPDISTPILRFFRNLYPNEMIIDEDSVSFCVGLSTLIKSLRILTDSM